MDEDNETQNACSVDITDAQGHTNLCCCYTMDEEGNLDDPCYRPVEYCCCE